MEEFKPIIENENKCWENIRYKLKPKSDYILSLSWHPHIKAQIKMFLQVEKEIDGSEL